jgi:hypothetical protein
METWNEDYFNEAVQAFIRFEENGLSPFQFGYVQGNMDWCPSTRDGEPAAEWCWKGVDGADGTPVTGRGWAKRVGDELHGTLFIYHGDQSGFVANKAEESTRVGLASGTRPGRPPRRPR